jgi:hypothetical protein
MCGCKRGCRARYHNAVHVGPMWLQQHSCKFIMGMKLKARGGRHIKARRGKKQVYFLSLAEARQVGIYMQQVHYMQGSNLNRNGN